MTRLTRKRLPHRLTLCEMAVRDPTLQPLTFMKEAEVRIVNRLGIHARPSAALTQLAGKFQSGVWFTKGARRVNGKSIMGVMMLAAACGTVLKIEVDGEDEDAALKALIDLIASGFGEELGAGA